MVWRLSWVYLGFFLLFTQNVCFADEEPADASSDEKKSDVVVLTSANFDEITSKTSGSNTVLVEFYAPWCGHCKSLEPKYEEAATQLKSKGIILGKVDATVEKDLAEKFSVTGYPTLKYFRDGKPYDYEGARNNPEAIIEFMEEVSSDDWTAPVDPVMVMNSDNFQETIDKNDNVMVEFYAPWCGHCKALEPKYKHAATILADKPIILAKVDATENEELANKYNVESYPTIKIFRKGKVIDYKGKRETDDIVQKMLSYLKPASQVLDSELKFKNFLHNVRARVVGFFFGDPNDSELGQAFLEVTERMRDQLEFGYVGSKEVSEDLGHTKPEIIVYHALYLQNKYEPAFKKYGGEATADALEKYLKNDRFSLVSVSKGATEPKDPERYSVFAYFDMQFNPAGNNAHAVRETKFWYNKIVAVAAKYKENKEVVFKACDPQTCKEDLKHAGIGENEDQVSVVIWKGTKTRYILKDGVNSLKSFIDRVMAGKVKPFLKSAKKPRRNKGPVKIVVGKTFKKIVLSKKKDVFIEFYAPWCGHCKKLEPIWKELGKLFKKEKRIVIAKMDAIANDVPGEQFDVNGFPSLYYVKKGNKKKPIKYEGDRDLNSFIKFIKKHASKKVTTVADPPPPGTGLPSENDPDPNDPRNKKKKKKKKADKEEL